jgi:hypothetical protein
MGIGRGHEEHQASQHMIRQPLCFPLTNHLAMLIRASADPDIPRSRRLLCLSAIRMLKLTLPGQLRLAEALS